MNIKTILALFGLDVKKPLEFLLKILVLVDDAKLTDEVQKKLCAGMTDKRKVEVAGMLRKCADALDAKDCVVFATNFVGILKGIKL